MEIGKALRETGALFVLEKKRKDFEYGDGDEIRVEAGCAAEDERLSGGFCAGGAGGAGGARVGVEDGAVSFVLFGIGAA
jgi:hypothetical protein